MRGAGVAWPPRILALVAWPITMWCESLMVFWFGHPFVMHLWLSDFCLCFSFGRMNVGVRYLGCFESLIELVHLEMCCVDRCPRPVYLLVSGGSVLHCCESFDLQVTVADPRF